MKIINYSIILFLILGCQSSGKKETITKVEERLIKNFSFTKSDSLFWEMINEEVVTNVEEEKYISNIAKLQSIELLNCDSMNIHYKDFVEGKQIEFKLSLKKFEKENHQIKYIVDEQGDIIEWESIDGKEPWGGNYGAGTEVDKLEISVNGNQIEMKDELRDVFNFRMCDSDSRIYFNPNPLLKYDKGNEVFYLYIKGGNAASHYFGKFVFNEKRFLKRYLVNYGLLSTTGSFRMNFKGF